MRTILKATTNFKEEAEKGLAESNRLIAQQAAMLTKQAAAVKVLQSRMEAQEEQGKKMLKKLDSHRQEVMGVADSQEDKDRTVVCALDTDGKSR